MSSEKIEKIVRAVLEWPEGDEDVAVNGLDGRNMERLIDDMQRQFGTPELPPNDARWLCRRMEELPGNEQSSLERIGGEVASIYVDERDRWIVSLVVGYSERDDVHDQGEAIEGALDLINGENSDGTHWFVYDRQTGHMHVDTQREHDPQWRDQ